MFTWSPSFMDCSVMSSVPLCKTDSRVVRNLPGTALKPRGDRIIQIIDQLIIA